MKTKLFLLLLTFNIIININSQATQDDLEINILPSDKYRLSKRDLINLKSDLERQMMQRVYEIQSSWDQRNKLRHFALRPPMQPSLPYKSPVYNPNLLSLFAKPSPDGKREMSTINNSGFSGYSFSQKKKHKNDSEIDPVQSLKEHDEKMEIAKKNLEADIDKKFQMILNEKEKDTKVIKSTEAKERVIKIVTDKEKYIDNKNVTHHMPPYDNKNNSNDKPKIYKTDQSEENSSSIHSDNTKHKEELDYNSIAEVMTKMFEKLNKKIEKSLMLKMIKGKDKNQIMQLMSFIKEHPDSVLSSSPKPDKKEGTKSKNISSKEKKTKEKLESKKNIIQQNASEAKNENSLEDEVNVQIKNEIQPTQMEIKNEIDKDEDRKYFRSVSPFDNNNTDNVNDNKNNNLDKKDRMDIKYDNQSRFLSTRTEIKPGDVTSNHKSNNILKKDKMKSAREKKEDNRSQFIFQDGPINLDIF